MAAKYRQVKLPNAAKANNLKQRKDNGFNFRVNPDLGGSVVSKFKVRVKEVGVG